MILWLKTIQSSMSEGLYLSLPAIFVNIIRLQNKSHEPRTFRILLYSHTEFCSVYEIYYSKEVKGQKYLCI